MFSQLMRSNTAATQSTQDSRTSTSAESIESLGSVSSLKAVAMAQTTAASHSRTYAAPLSPEQERFMQQHSLRGAISMDGHRSRAPTSKKPACSGTRHTTSSASPSSSSSTPFATIANSYGLPGGANVGTSPAAALQRQAERKAAKKLEKEQTAIASTDSRWKWRASGK